MRIVSFNVNSLRARLHQLQAIVDTLAPDIIGLQETKVADQEFPLQAITDMGYHAVYHGQKTHYGVALLCRIRIPLLQPPQRRSHARIAATVIDRTANVGFE